MKELQRSAILLPFGCWGYPLIEILWRGWSHWTMALAGGICFCLLGVLSERMKRCPFVLRCAAGAAVITAVELTFGCVCNLGLHWHVWDYSAERCNLAGQICLRYSAMWFALSGPMMALADRMNRMTDKRQGQQGGHYAAGTQHPEHVHYDGMLSEGKADYGDPACG